MSTERFENLSMDLSGLMSRRYELQTFLALICRSRDLVCLME